MSLVSVKCVYNTPMEIIVRDVRTGIMEMPSKERIAEVLNFDVFKLNIFHEKEYKSAHRSICS